MRSQLITYFDAANLKEQEICFLGRFVPNRPPVKIHLLDILALLPALEQITGEFQGPHEQNLRWPKFQHTIGCDSILAAAEYRCGATVP